MAKCLRCGATDEWLEGFKPLPNGMKTANERLRACLQDLVTMVNKGVDTREDAPVREPTQTQWIDAMEKARKHFAAKTK